MPLQLRPEDAGVLTRPLDLARFDDDEPRAGWQPFDQICELGPVLCLWPPNASRLSGALPAEAPWPGHAALLGMVAARSVHAEVTVDSLGVHEWIWFDAPHAALGLCLLPDSDFYVWAKLLQALQEKTSARSTIPVRGYGWNAAVGCVERIAQCGGSSLLLRDPARLSAMGAAVAHSEAYRRGATLLADR